MKVRASVKKICDKCKVIHRQRCCARHLQAPAPSISSVRANAPALLPCGPTGRVRRSQGRALNPEGDKQPAFLGPTLHGQPLHPPPRSLSHARASPTERHTMARIAGVDLPGNKQTRIALTHTSMASATPRALSRSSRKAGVDAVRQDGLPSTRISSTSHPFRSSKKQGGIEGDLR